MERFLIDYEIADQPEEESEAEREAERLAEEAKAQERAAEAERQRKAQQRYNQAWQAKEYAQLNLKIPKSLKKAFDLACRERGISGRAYLIEKMRNLCDDVFGVFDLDGGEAERGTQIADQGSDGAEAQKTTEGPK